MIIKVSNVNLGQTNEYRDKVRNTIRSGDVIAYSRGGFIGKLIRMWTGETFSHVGIAEVNEDGRVYLLEAKDGIGVIKSYLSETEEFYLIRHSVPFDEISRERAYSVLGAKYSYLDAILAGLGIKPKNKKAWQCVEYASYVLGIDIKIDVPGYFVDYLIENYPHEGV